MKTSFCLLPMVSVCAALLSACGGGGGGTVPAASSTVAGTISGLGSVVVNGVRYETIGASVVDTDDGTNIGTALGLGMTVAIDPLSDSPTRARHISVHSGIQGPASSVDASGLTLTVAGLPVVADASTFIVTSAGLAGTFGGLANGQNLEVHGLPQSDGTFKATRIEIEASVQNVKLVGTVSNLNLANSTFTLGSTSNLVTVSYAGTTAPAGLANGAVVSVQTASSAIASPYAASRLRLRSSSASTFTDFQNSYRGTSGLANEVNELYGMVSDLTPSGSGCAMKVQGVPATLSSSTLCASIQNGDYVEVKGRLSNGSLTAYRVEFKTAGSDRSLDGHDYHDDDDDNDHDGLKYRRQWHATSSDDGSYNSNSTYEIYGTLSSCSTNTCTLTSNGSVLTADLSTARWEHGQVTSGWVEAKGYMTSANTFKVVKIESKH